MFAATQNSSGSGISLLFFLAIPVALYFLMIRPQKRRMQAQQQVTKSLADGDEVITTSGMYGFITAIEDDVVWLEIAEGVDVRVTRSAVAKKVASASSADGAAAGEPKALDPASDPEPAPDAAT